MNFEVDTLQLIPQPLRDLMESEAKSHAERCEQYKKLVAEGKEMIDSRKKAVNDMIKACKEHKDDDDWVIVNKETLRSFVTGNHLVNFFTEKVLPG